MKTNENSILRYLITIIILSLTVSPALAQFRSGTKLSKPFITQVQDTISNSQELILIDLLKNSFQSLADKDRQGRMIGGYVLLGLGIGSGIGGAATLAIGEGDDARIVGYSLLGGAALLSGLSLVPFKIKSESEHIYAEFNCTPAETPLQIHQKYYYWDNRFREWAEKNKRGRIIGGISSIVTGGVFSLFIVEGSNRKRLHTFIWPAVGGITSILVKSDVERRYETYQKTKEDLLRQTPRTSFHFGITPLPNGGIAGVLQAHF